MPTRCELAVLFANVQGPGHTFAITGTWLNLAISL